MKLIHGIVLQMVNLSYLELENKQHTSSVNSFSHERCSNVRTSRMANTRGGSHISDGKDVMRRLRYLVAISRALVTRWVLHMSNVRSSSESTSGNAWADA